MKERMRGEPPSHLTRREQEVLELLAVGCAPGEIAERLCITYDTVSQHLAALRTKCGARSTLELAVKAARGGQ